MEMSVFSMLFPEYGVYFDICLTVIGAASVIATKTPNTSDDKVMQKILDVVNVLGMNVGKAKNAE